MVVPWRVAFSCKANGRLFLSAPFITVANWLEGKDISIQPVEGTGLAGTEEVAESKTLGPSEKHRGSAGICKHETKMRAVHK